MLEPLGPDEWRVIDEDDTKEYARGSEAHCKEFMEARPEYYYVLEDPYGTIYDQFWDDGESRYEPIAERE
jgi:hypothetical protein